jgi:two-component system sensor kinase FixL
MMVGGFLSRARIVGVALVCGVLQEAFSNLPENEAVVRLLLSSAGLVGTGLFISELIRNRRPAMTHVEELEGQIKLREDAEEQLRSLVESSPAAIVTIDSDGKVLLANEAAQHLLASGGSALQGQAISSYLPSLETVVKTRPLAHFEPHCSARAKERTEKYSF